jgi:hypothetical protein
MSMVVTFLWSIYEIVLVLRATKNIILGTGFLEKLTAFL